MLVFEENWKLEYPEENLSKQGLEPTAISTISHVCQHFWDTNLDHAGGRQVLSQPLHSCFHVGRGVAISTWPNVYTPSFY